MDKRREGSIKFSIENFLSHSAERLRRGTLLCYINFGYLKGLDKRGGEIQIRRRNFFLTVPKIFVEESFSVALFSGSEKVWIGERGEYQYFPLKTFCLTEPKISVGESFIVALISGTANFWIGGGSIKIFHRKFFVSQCRKIT